jgi:hypothetical protein
MATTRTNVSVDSAGKSTPGCERGGVLPGKTCSGEVAKGEEWGVSGSQHLQTREGGAALAGIALWGSVRSAQPLLGSPAHL